MPYFRIITLKSLIKYHSNQTNLSFSLLIMKYIMKNMRYFCIYFKRIIDFYQNYTFTTEGPILSILSFSW